MTDLTIDRALELVELLRRVMHAYCPYENTQRYRLLEDLRALETNLIRDKNQNEVSDNG